MSSRRQGRPALPALAKRGRATGKKQVKQPDFATAYSASMLRATGNRLGFPAQQTVQLAYCSSGTLASNTGTLGSHLWRLNSVYDPDETGSGHQPMGFDQWAAFYNHYVVKKCKWSIEFVSDSGNAVCGFYVGDDSNLPSELFTLIELGSQSGILKAGGTAAVANLKGSVSISEFLRRGNINTDSTLRAGVSSNPTEQVIGMLWLQDPGLANTCTADYVIKLTYDVVFSEPKDLTTS